MSRKKRANGEGGIGRYKDRWRAYITIGRNDKGKLIRKYFYGKTQKEAQEKKDAFREKFNKGLEPTDEKITLQKWINMWLFEYRVNDLKPSSFERYEGIYRNYIKESPIGMLKLKDLRTSHIQSFYNTLIKEKGRTPYTIKTINKVLKCALNQALKENYISINYFKNVTLPKIISTEEVEVFTREERERFLNSIKNHKYELLFRLALGTGMRIGEITALKWCDINVNKNELKVQRTIKRVTAIDNMGNRKTEIKEFLPKTKSSIRTINISDKIMKQIISYKTRMKEVYLELGINNIDDIFVFQNDTGKPIDSSNLRKIYKDILENNNIPFKKFHSLRHTYATMLFEKDVDLKTISNLLGHSSIKVTADIYTHVMVDKKVYVAEVINELFA